MKGFVPRTYYAALSGSFWLDRTPTATPLNRHDPIVSLQHCDIVTLQYRYKHAKFRVETLERFKIVKGLYIIREIQAD